MKQPVINGTHPEWLTQWHTVLIMKDRKKGAMQANNLTLDNMEDPIRLR